MAIIEPTIDHIDDETVMRELRNLASSVDKNEKALNDEMASISESQEQLEQKVNGFQDSIDQNTQDIADVKQNIVTIENDITAVETKNAEQDTAIQQNATAIETEKNARIENDITDVGLTYNPNTGSLEIQLLRGEGNLEDSVIARFIKNATLIPTSTSRAFKIRFEFYDGTSYDTNEFLIPEGGGTDVSVTGVTVVDGTTPDSFQVQIQLSDGEPLKSNDYVIEIPASENIYPIAVTGTVNGTNINIDITLNNNQHVKGTVDISTLATNEDIADLQEQITAIKPTVTVNTDVSPPTISVAVNGITSTANLPSEGSNVTIEELDVSNLPTDFTVKDYIIISIFNMGQQGVRCDPQDWETGVISIEGDISVATIPRHTIFHSFAGPGEGVLFVSGTTVSYLPIYIYNINNIDAWNNTDSNTTLMEINCVIFNGKSKTRNSVYIKRTNIHNYVGKIVRIRYS